MTVGGDRGLDFRTAPGGELDVDAVHQRLVELTPGPEPGVLVGSPGPHRLFRVDASKGGNQPQTTLFEPCRGNGATFKFHLRIGDPLHSAHPDEVLGPPVHGPEVRSQIEQCPTRARGDRQIVGGVRLRAEKRLTSAFSTSQCSRWSMPPTIGHDVDLGPDL